MLKKIKLKINKMNSNNINLFKNLFKILLVLIAMILCTYAALINNGIKIYRCKLEDSTSEIYCTSIWKTEDGKILYGKSTDGVICKLKAAKEIYVTKKEYQNILKSYYLNDLEEES